MSGKPLVATWRDALRDSKLDASAKLTGLVLSTYVSSSGRTGPTRDRSPARVTLATGASLNPRAVDRALARLEDAGFLVISPPKRMIGGKLRRPGGKGAVNFYTLALPLTASESRTNEWDRATLELAKSDSEALKRGAGSHESAESAESGRAGAAAPDGATPSRDPEDECVSCGEWKRLLAPDYLHCAECVAGFESLAAEGAS